MREWEKRKCLPLSHVGAGLDAGLGLLWCKENGLWALLLVACIVGLAAGPKNRALGLNLCSNCALGLGSTKGK